MMYVQSCHINCSKCKMCLHSLLTYTVTGLYSNSYIVYILFMYSRVGALLRILMW